MAQSQPRTIYGIHEMSFYSRLTGLPYGNLRVLGGSSLVITGEVVSLTGGSARYPWDAQDGAQTAELAFKPAEIPSFLFGLLLGKTPTEVSDDPGNVTALANVEGDTLFDATDGVASVGVKSGSEGDLKFGSYVVKAVTADTVDVYAKTNVDFFRGTDKVYEDDLLKITATPLTIVTATAVEVPGFGIELTGGSGTIVMDAGDTADFEANPPSSYQMDVVVGELGACIPEFGAVVTAQKQADGSMWLFDCFKVKAQGFPFNMEKKAYSEAEVTGILTYDATKNGIFKARYVKPSTGCS